jgi:hypothetical protein
LGDELGQIGARVVGDDEYPIGGLYAHASCGVGRALPESLSRNRWFSLTVTCH